MSQNLPPVQPLDLEELFKTFGMPESKLQELHRKKDLYKQGTKEIKEIEDQINAILDRLRKEEAERAKNQNNNTLPTPLAGDSDNNAAAAPMSNSNNMEKSFSDLSENRQKTLEIINDGKKGGSITETKDGPNLISISNQVLSFKDKKTFDSVTDSFSEVYNNLEAMGLDVRRAEKSEGENSASFYAIRFPKDYKGQRDVMKITQEEINEIKSQLEKENPEQKKSVDSRDYATAVLGHVSLATNDKLIFDSLGLEKVEEKSAKNKEDNKEKTMVQKLLEQQEKQKSGLTNIVR